MQELYRIIMLLLMSAPLAAQLTPTIVVPYPLCTESALTFTAASDSVMPDATYSWFLSPSKAIILSDSTGPAITYSFTQRGSYKISLRISYGSGSVQLSTVKNIFISKKARASFNASLTSLGYPAKLLLTNYSTNNLKSYWIFNDTSAPDSAINITRSYNQSGNYTVSLIAIGNNGCDHVSTHSFSIHAASSITLPNIFTPNADGVNDIYRPLSEGLVSLHARIYNRDGNIIATWDRINGFWDGRTTSGELCDDGVYYIVVEAAGFDGVSYRKKGSITLVR
jgi:gliding motility-associated-like protein